MANRTGTSRESTEAGKALLMEDFQRSYQQHQQRWKEGAAKRELASRVFEKLIKGDPELEKLWKEVNENDLAAPTLPLPPPKPELRKSKETTNISVEDFAPTSIHLESFPNGWQAPDPSSMINVQTGGAAAMSFSLTTEDGPGNIQACAMAIGGNFQPPPGSGQMTVSVNPWITYSYGNRAWAQPAETHAWIGLYISEWDPGFEPMQLVQVNSRQKIDLWDYTHDSDLGPSSETYPLSVTMSSVPEHLYQIWVWAGGDVASPATSDGNLSVSLTDMYIRVA